MIKRFNEDGIQSFKEFLITQKAHPSTESPYHIVQSRELTTDVGGASKELDLLNLSDKLATARSLNKIIDELQISAAESDRGLWCWCSAYLFARLCKKDQSGRFKVGELSNWVLYPQNFQREYRHYLASIWQVFASHKNLLEIEVLLSGEVNTPGELWEQIVSRLEYVKNENLIKALHILYWDAKSRKRKKGSGGESVRRLDHVLKQFARTHDLFNIRAEDLVRMLPSEFDRFKSVENI